MRYALIAVCVVLVAPGCSKKKKSKPSADQPAAERSAPEDPSPAEATRESRRQEYMAKKAEIKRRRVPMPIAAEDIEGAIPAIEGSEVLGAPTAGANGRQVVTELCMNAADAAAAAETLKAALVGAGWTDVNARPARRGSGVGMSGQKQPLRLTAMIRAESPRCQGNSGSTHALLRFHKLLTKDAAQTQNAQTTE